MNHKEVHELKVTPFELMRALEVLRSVGIQIHFSRLNHVKLFTVEETADFIRVDVSWVRRNFSEFPNLIKLPGGGVRIPLADIESYLDKCRAKRLRRPAAANLTKELEPA